MINVAVKTVFGATKSESWSDTLINVDDIKLVRAEEDGCLIETRDDSVYACGSSVQVLHKMIKQARMDRNKRESVF